MALLTSAWGVVAFFSHSSPRERQAMAQLRPLGSSSSGTTVGDDLLAKAECRREHEESLHVGWLDGVRGQAVWGWVVAHTLRFVLPRPYWLRLFPAQAQLPALRSFTVPLPPKSFVPLARRTW